MPNSDQCSKKAQKRESYKKAAAVAVQFGDLPKLPHKNRATTITRWQSTPLDTKTQRLRANHQEPQALSTTHLPGQTVRSNGETERRFSWRRRALKPQQVLTASQAGHTRGGAEAGKVWPLPGAGEAGVGGIDVEGGRVKPPELSNLTLGSSAQDRAHWEETCWAWSHSRAEKEKQAGKKEREDPDTSAGRKWYRKSQKASYVCALHSNSRRGST